MYKMLGIIMYEVFDILYYVTKIGYNCAGYGLGLVFTQNDNNQYKNIVEEENSLYIERIENLERRLRALECKQD